MVAEQVTHPAVSVRAEQFRAPEMTLVSSSIPEEEEMVVQEEAEMSQVQETQVLVAWHRRAQSAQEERPEVVAVPWGEENFFPVTGHPLKTAEREDCNPPPAQHFISHRMTRISASSRTTLSEGREPPVLSSPWMEMYWTEL